ncbi:MAG TPA: hypothetical protein VKP64_11495 [Mycobacteriales bacterium]|nr:hypothetical protein [Mycobacteriales bacterium]
MSVAPVAYAVVTAGGLAAVTVRESVAVPPPASVTVNRTVNVPVPKVCPRAAGGVPLPETAAVPSPKSSCHPVTPWLEAAPAPALPDPSRVTDSGAGPCSVSTNSDEVARPCAVAVAAISANACSEAGLESSHQGQFPKVWK